MRTLGDRSAAIAGTVMRARAGAMLRQRRGEGPAATRCARPGLSVTYEILSGCDLVTIRCAHGELGAADRCALRSAVPPGKVPAYEVIGPSDHTLSLAPDLAPNNRGRMSGITLPEPAAPETDRPLAALHTLAPGDEFDFPTVGGFLIVGRVEAHLPGGMTAVRFRRRHSEWSEGINDRWANCTEVAPR